MARNRGCGSNSCCSAARRIGHWPYPATPACCILKALSATALAVTEILAIFFGACLVNNLILHGMLGVAPAMASAKRLDVALGMSMCMMLVLTISAPVSYLVKQYLLAPLGLAYLELAIFMLIISLSVLLAFKILKKFKAAMHEELAVFLPLALMNAAVLSLALINVQHGHGLLASLLFGFGSATGFGLVLVTMSAMQEHMEAANIPAPFQGPAIMLITLGLLSMALTGFAGMGVQ